MSIRAAFEAKLRASPEDWDAWRVYGDWLTEQGDVRGELVHLEHRLAKGSPSDEERAAIEARITAVETEHWPVWRAELAVPKESFIEWQFGFVVGVSLPAMDETELQALWRGLEHPAAWFLANLDPGDNDLGAEGAAALARFEALRGRLGPG